MRIKLEATWEREMLGKNLQSPSLSGLFSCFLEKILYNQVQHDIITLSVRLIKKFSLPLLVCDRKRMETMRVRKYPFVETLQAADRHKKCFL